MHSNRSLLGKPARPITQGSVKVIQLIRAGFRSGTSIIIPSSERADQGDISAHVTLNGLLDQKKDMTACARSKHPQATTWDGAQ